MMAMLFGITPPEPMVNPDAGVFIDTFSTVDTPPVTVLTSTKDGRQIAELERADASALYAAGWKAPVRAAVKAADGTTDVYTVYYAPNDGGTGKRPVVDAVYGGPQVVVAPRNFVDAYRGGNPIGEAALARLGFAVAVTDGRGTPGRSNVFRDAGYTEFTQVGIDDHVAAIKQLAKRHPEMDLDRVGIHGWSWGGTFTAQAILSRPDFYDVAVSGAGVYDYVPLYGGFEPFTGVPEYSDGSRIRTRPDEKPANMDHLDITSMAGNLKGHLLIVYGDMDENVPQLQAFRLVDALIKANKPYDLLYLPNRTHGGGGEGYTIQRTWDYYVEHLLDADPPLDVKVEMKPRSPV
jgi:dipeptidyl aminopeptidase/acylaminoacyl peptidase